MNIMPKQRVGAMPEIEMMVSLIMPDNTGLTAANTLRKMGYQKLLNLKRETYYKFYFRGDTKTFSDKISHVDILVNANKNKVWFKRPGEPFADARTRILVKEINDGTAGLLSTLRNRLGLKNISKVEKGTLWTVSIDERSENVTPIAWDMARKLLYNKHYQTAEIIANR